MKKKKTNQYVLKAEPDPHDTSYKRRISLATHAVRYFLLEKIHGKGHGRDRLPLGLGNPMPFELYADATLETQIKGGTIFMTPGPKKKSKGPERIPFPDTEKKAEDFWINIAYGIGTIFTSFTYFAGPKAPKHGLSVPVEKLFSHSKMESYRISFFLRRKGNTDDLLIYNLSIEKESWKRTSKRKLKV